MNGHDFTREQNMEARIRLAAARRELADAVNDATTGIGCLTCDDPQTMNHIRACWKRIYDRYLETDWYRMLDERQRMFDRYLMGMRCARYVLFGVWILAFAIVGLILVEVSS